MDEVEKALQELAELFNIHPQDDALKKVKDAAERVYEDRYDAGYGDAVEAYSNREG